MTKTARLGVAAHNRPERRKLPGTDINVMASRDTILMVERAAKRNRRWSKLWFIGWYFKGRAMDWEALLNGKPVPSLEAERALGVEGGMDSE